jgi:hypothetical protein
MAITSSIYFLQDYWMCDHEFCFVYEGKRPYNWGPERVCLNLPAYLVLPAFAPQQMNAQASFGFSRALKLLTLMLGAYTGKAETGKSCDQSAFFLALFWAGFALPLLSSFFTALCSLCNLLPS